MHINCQTLGDISLVSQSQESIDRQNNDLICFIIKTKCKNVRRKCGASLLLYEMYVIDETFYYGDKNKEIVYQAWGDEASMLQHQGIVQGTFILIHNYEYKYDSKSFNDTDKRVITLHNGKLFIFHDKNNSLTIPTNFHDECLPILNSKLKSLHDWITASPYASIKGINDKFDCIQSKYAENLQSLYSSPSPKFDIILIINKDTLLSLLNSDKFVDRVEAEIDVKDCNNQPAKLCNVYKSQLEGLKLELQLEKNMRLNEIMIYSSRLTVSYIYYSKIRKINAEVDSTFVLSSASNHEVITSDYEIINFMDLIEMNNNPVSLLQYKGKVVLVHCSLRYILWNTTENNGIILLENLIKVTHDYEPEIIPLSSAESGKKRKQRSTTVYDSRIKTSYANAFFFLGSPKGNANEDDDVVLKVKVTDSGLTKIFANIPSSLVSVSITKESITDTSVLTCEQQRLFESLPIYNYASAVRSIINSLNECAIRRDNFLFEIQILPLTDENGMVIVSNCQFVLKGVKTCN